MASRDEAVRRCDERTRAPTEPTHGEAWEMTKAAGGIDEVGAMYDRPLTMLQERPGAIVVDMVPDDPSATYVRVLNALRTQKP